MAHFAKINSSNTVEEVIVVDNSAIKNLDYPKSERVGQEFLRDVGLQGKWLQTSYNGSFRKNYAAKGDTYDVSRDAYIHPKPFPSWILNEETCKWEAPVPIPGIDDLYEWNESLKKWVVD